MPGFKVNPVASGKQPFFMENRVTCLEKNQEQKGLFLNRPPVFSHCYWCFVAEIHQIVRKARPIHLPRHLVWD